MESSSKTGAGKRFVRSRIAALSAMALAAGTLVAVPSFISTQPAEAAPFTGGIRDKSGAVEKDGQQASDLPAGECVVEGADEPSGSQAGFTWDTLEPSKGSTSKTAWGLSLAFDNSKDRTFADWSFTNSGNLGAVLDNGTVSSLDVGKALFAGAPPVTAKADEDIEISGRRQRQVNLSANLTADKVKQYAEAKAANPVRYAWQSNYKQEHTSTPYATHGSSALFSAKVNPWPSENIECNPITVSWKSIEKHVIVPGEKTKVGQINIPALKKDGTDDSLSRMLVEAYDGEGKFIGTSDPGASGGGEQLLSVDENGDIYFTWPKYRGTDLATDKNVNFSVLAKPRTVEQLQTAAENNSDQGEGKVFDSSNSLDRYKKANVIDSKAFSLDDTEYHNPQYDKVEATITSGVVKANEGPLATEPQKVVFTQTPDLIKELEKKKGDGGFEAKAQLDQKYVYEGWSVEMDENYNVTVTAPKNPNPGTFARPKVKIEYSNGSTDEIELLVVVAPNHTQVTDLVRPDLTKGRLNDNLTSQIGLKPIMKGYKAVNPDKYEVDPASVPEGWTVTVDATGKVTAKADGSVVNPGSTITPKIKATYPDQTTDEIEVQFQAIVDIKIPTYDTVTGQPEANMTLKPKIPEQGLSGNQSDQAPKRYTFEDGSNQQTFKSKSGKTWTVRVNEKTGEITTTIPKDAPEGDILDVPVLGHYEDGNFKPQKVKGTVVVLKGDLKATYDVQVTGPGNPVTHQVTGAPTGSKFSFGNDEGGNPILTKDVNGWKYQIDPETGAVSSTPPKTAKPGDKNTVSVKVDAPGGRTTMTPVTTVVKLSNNWESNPVIPPKTVYPGDTVSSPLAIDKPEGINVAKEKPFEIAPLPEHITPTGEKNDFGNPTYKLKTDNGDWIVGLDDKGNVISTAPKTAKPGDKIQVPVTVTYEDGSQDTTSAVVNVADVPTREIPFGVEYKFDDSIPAGEYKVGTKGMPGKESMNKDGKWERAVDPETGKTLDPVNEVVSIGTKQAEAKKQVTWTADVAFQVVTRPNSELKPGEIKVVQKGVAGVKTYTASFSSKGSEASVTPKEEVTQKPVDEIIEYGPTPEDTTVVTKVAKPIPFKTKIVFDDTLETGKKVVQDGVFGSETVTSTQKIVNGKPEGDPTVTTERTQEPSDQIIRVGTKCVCEKPSCPTKPGNGSPHKPGQPGLPGNGSHGSSDPGNASNPGGSLAATGAQQGLAALLGAGMIGVGLVLVYARRRSRRD